MVQTDDEKYERAGTFSLFFCEPDAKSADKFPIETPNV